MTTKSRRLHVLQAIVVEHVNTKEPVSSKAVAQGHVTGVSAATIRSDMSALEDEGLIHQPHTSAGRIPTEAGYRQFVDSLGDPQPVDSELQRRIRQDLAESDSPAQVFLRTVRALSRITQQAAIVEYPDLSVLGIRRVELIELSAGRILVLVVSSSGRVAERLLDVSVDLKVTAELLSKVSNVLSEACKDKNIADAREALAAASKIEGLAEDAKRLIMAAGTIVKEVLRPLAVNRIETSGASNLARTRFDFSDVSTVLDALEDEEVLASVLTNLHTAPLQVSIGAENQSEALLETSVVTATYDASGPRAVHVGILGPTRMDYPRSLAAVRAVSKCLSDLLLIEQGGNPADQEKLDSSVNQTSEDVPR